MSRSLHSVSSRAWVQLLTGVLTLLLVVAVVTQLRTSAPHEQLDVVVGAAEDPGSTSRDEVTCERRLPGLTRVQGGEGSEDPVEDVDGPIGRITSTAVTECPDRFDGRQVTFIGEVVGDVLRRDGGAWLLMNDDAYGLEAGPLPSHQDFAGGNTGLAVWLPDRFLGLIQDAGGPGVRGTVLSVEGTVHRADPADGGGLTLRAHDAARAADAVRIPEPVHTAQVVVAILAAIAAAGAIVAERLVARSR